MKRLETLLVAQAFSPALFRLGDVPGPTLNLQYHLEDLSEEALKKRWADTQKKQKTWNRQLRYFPIPCAVCQKPDFKLKARFHKK